MFLLLLIEELYEQSYHYFGCNTKIIEESSNWQAAVESNESDDIIIESYVGPSSEGPSNVVKM